MTFAERTRRANEFFADKIGVEFEVPSCLFRGYAIDSNGWNPHFLFGRYTLMGFHRSGHLLLQRTPEVKWLVSPVELKDHWEFCAIGGNDAA